MAAQLYDELMLSLHDMGKLDASISMTARARNSVPARLVLAGIQRSGSARRHGRRIRPGTDIHPRYSEMIEPERAPVKVLEETERPLPHLALA